MSPFAHHYVAPLLASPNLLGGIQDLAQIDTFTDSSRKQKLRALLSTLEQPTATSHSDLLEAAEFLVQLEQPIAGLPSEGGDNEQLVLQRAVANKVAVALYADALDTLMTQCVQLEDEAEWWEDVERSRYNVAWYLIQTLPSRIVHFVQFVLQTARHEARSQASPLTWAARSSLQPSILLSTLFPHAHSASSLVIRAPTPADALQSFRSTLTRCLHSTFNFVHTPLVLTRSECFTRKQALCELRDQRAAILGEISELRPILAKDFDDKSPIPRVYAFANFLQGSLVGVKSSYSSISAISLRDLLVRALPSCRTQHNSTLADRNLARPSRLVLLWPKILFLPPLALYATRLLYESRSSLFDMALEAHDTMKAFVRGWLLEPVKDILNTVRAQGDEGVIVRKEGVDADLQSLERMTLALAKEHLNYGPEQLTSLSTQVKAGDITAVLKMYENDIRSPLKSVLTGTLLRTLFIQVQKAKVDIDQALFGIDKLLKSQELTFAFVGVAPAFGIVYLFGRYLANLWSSRTRGRYGGKYKRRHIWFIMRRIERLLMMDSHSKVDVVSPLTAGLMLVSIAHLRSYGEKHLPKRSKIKEGFLGDVEDLSNPALNRKQKRMIVERIWRSWAHILEWGLV